MGKPLVKTKLKINHHNVLLCFLSSAYFSIHLFLLYTFSTKLLYNKQWYKTLFYVVLEVLLYKFVLFGWIFLKQTLHFQTNL